jgi:C4-dicarboxylate-specific signal transduction histidine kinase
MTIEKEIENTESQWFQMRIMPYRTLDNVIDGVVITFIDITARKEAEIALEMSRTQLQEKVREQTGELKTARTELSKEVAGRKKREKAPQPKGGRPKK